MPYERPVNTTGLSKEQKLSLLKEYIPHYEREAALDRSVLKRKVPRGAFARLLDRIGGQLLQESKSIALKPGPL